MKIFIGGQRAHDMKQRHERMYPGVEFDFADVDDGHNKWMNRARRADVVIIDQSRCNHRITNRLKEMHCPMYLADGKAQVAKLLEEIIKHGTTSHRYARPAGSVGFAFTSTESLALGGWGLPHCLAEAGAGDPGCGPTDEG